MGIAGEVGDERVTLVLALPNLIGQSDLSVDPPAERQSPPARHAAAKLKEVVVRNADHGFWQRITVQAAPAPAQPRTGPDPTIPRASSP